MKLDRALFAAILAMCAVVLFLVMLPAADGAGGVEHPELGTMRQGGSGAERHGGVLWVGWLFGVVAFAVFMTLMAFGARQNERLRGGLGRRLVAVGAAAVAAWTWIVIAYRDSMDQPAVEFFLALPVPTAIMLYLFWPVTLTSMLCFVLGFKRWVLTDEDLARFEQLLAAKRRREEDGSGEEA